MCGIIGYVGPKEVITLLIDGLRRLEYRGYDSAGVALLVRKSEGGKEIFIRKKKGKITELASSLNRVSFSPGPSLSAQESPNLGIGHTRWATHGKPSDRNAHPHSDCSRRFAVVHNGIIENYASLKEELLSEGHQFSSETDTEVIAHLIEREMNGNFTEAMIRVLNILEGSYALGILSLDNPNQLMAARRGSPLILGCGCGENFLASDVPAVLPHTKEVVYLEDEELAILHPHRIEILRLKNGGLMNCLTLHTTGPEAAVLQPRIHQIPWESSMAEKCGYKHFMLKEIYEQPRAIQDTIRRYVNRARGTIHFEEMTLSDQDLRSVQHIYIIGCGTSYHAALIGKLMLEKHAQIQVEADIASEFRYRSPLFHQNSLVIAISQSGETADTLAAVRQAKKKGAKVLSICNVVGSSVARESHGIIYTHAGPEIGVASTKAFTTQAASLYLFTIHLASTKGTISYARQKEMIEALCSIPNRMEMVLAETEQIKSVASLLHQKKNFLYLGRAFGFPIALEGALKLKEISYIHAEGYAAGEMKHGPIALIDEEMPVLALAPKSDTYDKILSNMEEVKARGGMIIAIATQGDRRILEKADHVFYIPEASEELSGLLMVLPLQLFAYHVADYRGCDIDQPRNLAKSVTVE